jgi:hypothetical protein
VLICSKKKGKWFTAEDIPIIVAGVTTTMTLTLLRVGDILVDTIITMTHPVVEEVAYFQGAGVDSTDIITTLRTVIVPVTTILLPLQTILPSRPE